MSAMPQPRPEPRSLSSVPVIARLSSDNVIDGFEVAALPLKPAVAAAVKAQPSEGKENREVDIEECEYDSDEGTESPPLYRGVTGFPGAQVLDSLREEVFSLCHPESLPRLMEEFEEVETLERRWDYLLEAREFLLECDAAASELLLQEFERGNALLPHGAAALRLGAPHDYAGHFCCTFPLASLACGPPLLLHGNFGLPSSRKSLPLALNVADGRWNAALLQGALASALGLVVERCRDLVLGRKLSLSAYFELIELPDNDTNRASAEPRSEAREGFEPGIDRDAAWRDPQSPVFESRLDSCALHCCSACSVAHLSTPSRWQHSARMTQNP